MSGISSGIKSLPAWTITKWDLDKEERPFASGFFSSVYKGVLRGREVAIKILDPKTPWILFQRQSAIWASLEPHPNILLFLGVSSATGNPPWFLVSPYMKNGNLVDFLKAKSSLGHQERYKNPSALRMLHEIATRMVYLHDKQVLHGDLRANDILIDDELRCVISDFGQSQLRGEISKLNPLPICGMLRWQAPEIINGEGTLTPQVDVYAFAIVCMELLGNGQQPWLGKDDDTV
ncbi:hypothetical protein M422DRAFT_184717 [Sphaerobolus stellatus SS14]|uniref:Protein kinase domain-containing protein n=1 Tax=Sphaerobolus stellatus (strain SS14) TaxID=990650 RepID=A0A0C9TQ92_SPHS4|nr:hypothetical protein M422DRAFT_184717 [Sphaerobolus stellatus SS14]